MATNQQSPLEQVLAAAAPALAYQPDEYELAEAKYYAEQEAKMRGLGKGKDAYIAPFPPRPQEEPIQQLPIQQLPTIQVQATPEPTPLQQVLNPTPQGQPRTLTPCDLGMCEGLSYGTNGQYTVAASAPTGKFLMNSGHAGGRNLLGQMLLAGELEKRGATVEQLEKNNMRTELADLNDMRRSPQWSEQYNSLVQQGLDPRVAAAQSDRLTGNLYGGQVGSIVSRYVDPVNQARVQALGDQQVGRLTAMGAFDDIGAANPSVEGGYQAVVPSSITQDGEGNYVTTTNMGGREIQSAPISPDRLAGVITGSTAPNAGTANTWSIANAQAASDRAVAQANNQNAYNKAQLEQRAIQQQSQIENNVLRNQISALAAAAKAQGGGTTSSKSDNALVNPVLTEYQTLNKDQKPDNSKAGQEKQAANERAITSFGLNPDGTYSQTAVDKLATNPNASFGVTSYNNALRINPADISLATDPTKTAQALLQLNYGIQHAQKMRQHLEQKGFTGANSRNSRAAYDEFGRNLDRMLKLQSVLHNQYNKFRTPNVLNSTAGITLGQ